MQKIPLMCATSGMKLARDVFRNDSPVGMPVCGKDTVLTDSLLARLDHLEVKSIYVEGHPLWSEGEKTLDEILCDLDLRFEKVRNDPLTSKLHSIYTAFLKNSMGDSSGRQTL
ncbi:hypothetical protein [Pelotalea chapellei]|uniref:Uncharacterized protein n=1 Tax=Pelotalea chapellei TaxID=44671 RepID=A0ABS5UCV9_9BACT|nr:hypothetical protein [Pelotalea chapellei]MBT1073542.1 hypothetical protein [Pelotalea chapellei]